MTLRILLTGAAGGVATMLRPLLLARYGALLLSDRVEMKDLQQGESFVQAELSDPDQARQATTDIDAVIHLGGQPHEAPWDVIMKSNILGLHNTFEACRENGVERLIFASSNHAIGMYPRNRRLGANDPVRPDSRYGVSKVFGEAMGALYADKHGMRVLSVRIGNVAEKPADLRRLSIWIHPEDMMQLCAIGLEHPDLHHEIVYGISDNARSWWDNKAAFRLGYRPAHRAEDHVQYAAHAEAGLPADPIGDHLQGGGFCSEEFSGELERILSN